MFFQSRCNTFVTFVYFYIRLFGKKLEKSCLTEGKKCVQKCVKKGLCAICIVEDLRGAEGILEDMRAIFRLTWQNIEDLLPESAPWRKIIHGERDKSERLERSAALICSAPKSDELQATRAPGRKTALLYIEETQTVITAGGWMRDCHGLCRNLCRGRPRQRPIIYR